MSKKSIDKKQIREQIKAFRAEGRPDQEVYNLLAPHYYDRKTVAQIITATVTDERKQKYRDAQITLLVLVGLTIGFKLLAAANLIFTMRSSAALLFLFLLPAVNVYFLVQLWRYDAAVYRVCGLFAIMGLTRILNGMAKEANWLILVDVGLIVAIAGLAFYLDSKLFPHYSPRNLKPDSNGDYKVE